MLKKHWSTPSHCTLLRSQPAQLSILGVLRPPQTAYSSGTSQAAISCSSPWAYCPLPPLPARSSFLSSISVSLASNCYSITRLNLLQCKLRKVTFLLFFPFLYYLLKINVLFHFISPLSALGSTETPMRLPFPLILNFIKAMLL